MKMGCTPVVNKDLLYMKAVYFLELGAVASLLPYMGVYMRRVGLTYSELAIIYGSSPFITSVFRACIGMLADRLQRHREILLICCICSGLLHSLLMWAPRVPALTEAANVTLTCSESGPLLQWCDANSDHELQPDEWIQCTWRDSSLDMASLHNYSSEASSIHTQNITALYPSLSLQDSGKNCSYYQVTQIYQEQPITGLIQNCVFDNGATCHLESSADKSSEHTTFGKIFWIFFVMFMVAQIFYVPIFSLLDALIYCNLEDKGANWGNQRMFGTIGFAMFALMSGLMMDSFTNLGAGRQINSFLFAFISFALLSAIGGVVVMFSKVPTDVKCTTLLKNLCSLLKQFRVVVLFTNTFLFGFYSGIIETFLFVRLDELGAPKILIGLCLLFNCVPEIVMLQFTAKVIKKLGIFPSLCLVYPAYCVRMVVYAFLKNPWYCLLVEPLHSLTYALMYATVTYHGNQLTPSGMHGTIQSVLGALYYGIGQGLGGIISGQVYEISGAPTMFLGFAISGAVALAVYIIIHYLYLRRYSSSIVESLSQQAVAERKDGILLAPTTKDVKSPDERLDVNGDTTRL